MTQQDEERLRIRILSIMAVLSLGAFLMGILVS